MKSIQFYYPAVAILADTRGWVSTRQLWSKLDQTYSTPLFKLEIAENEPTILHKIKIKLSQEKEKK